MPRKKDPWGDAVGTAPWAAVLRPAPGDLRILQALLNTADAVAGTDELGSPRALAGWLARWGLAAAEAEIGAAELERAIALRDGLRALARANVGLPLDKDAVAGLDRAAAAATFRVRFVGLATRVEPAVDGLDGAFARLVRIAARAREDGSWKRLKVCDNEACGRSFYDFSRNGSGRWCVQRCANLIKSRIYRRKNPGGRWPTLRKPRSS
jgi:predicted RNA-binding Zn ribbon-like protein